MVIVHKTFLLEQWKKRIAQFLPSARVGLVRQSVVDVLHCGFYFLFFIFSLFHFLFFYLFFYLFILYFVFFPRHCDCHASIFLQPSL